MQCSAVPSFTRRYTAAWLDAYRWNSHSALSSGHTPRVRSQRLMQWKWKAWLQVPHATVQSVGCALLPRWLA